MRALVLGSSDPLRASVLRSRQTPAALLHRWGPGSVQADGRWEVLCPCLAAACRAAAVPDPRHGLLVQGFKDSRRGEEHVVLRCGEVADPRFLQLDVRNLIPFDARILPGCPILLQQNDWPRAYWMHGRVRVPVAIFPWDRVRLPMSDSFGNIRVWVARLAKSNGSWLKGVRKLKKKTRGRFFSK